MPTGTTFVASTRVLSGNPSAVFTSATFTYTATDADGNTDELTFTIVVTAAAVPLALAWIVPTTPVGNTFSVTLTSNHSLGGVELDDFRLRIADNSDPIIALTAANTTITAVAGTNNWKLDIEVTGTLDADYTMRLRRETVQYDGVDYPAVFLVSDTFAIDSSIDDVALDFGSETIDDQSWTVGTAASVILPTATGGAGTITYSLSPTLPSGVTFTASTRVLAGNPTGRFTSATFTYTAEDAGGTTVELTFTIVVTATAISFASNIANQSWQVGTGVSLILPTASGGVGAFTYSLTPALPAGVTRTVRVVSGIPTTVVTVATYTYTATDSESVAHTQTFTIVVSAASAIVFSGTIANQGWTVDTAITSLTLPTATGGVGTITYSLTPTLPTGTTFTASTRVLSGTPTGRFTSATFTYTATDTAGTTNVLTFAIVVTAAAIVFSPTSFANQSWVVGTAVSRTLPAGSGGVGTLTASLSPTTPAGVTFTASTRALAGNPTATFTSATFTYTMTDAEGESESITFTIVVTAAVVVLSFASTISNQAWVAGTAITSVTLPEATGGEGEKTYTLSPTTPAGVTFTASTRVLAGNPTATFTSATFTYTATDEDDDTVELTFTIVVTADAIVFASTIADQSWVVGTAVDETLPTATGGVGDLTYTLTPTTPAGVTFTASTRALAGNPTAVFTLATFTYTVTDAESETETQTFTIVVSVLIAVAPTTSTDATYDADLGYNVLPESLGALKKIDASGSVESLGNLWYAERPYNVAMTRPLSVDGSLHVTMGYGNANEVLRYNSLASKADNFVHLVFGDKLKYIIPAFQATGNIYGKMAELARMVGATISFDGDLISVVDRRPFRAVTDSATGTGTGDLDFDSENKAFPPSGYLRMGDEFIGYTGISSGAFTGITRGALGSEPVNHSDNTGILYANALFSEREILQINASTDTTRHHNIIRDSENAFEVKDDTNIAQYRPQPYTLDLGLTRNEDAWVETIFAEYLLELKNLGSVFDVRLRPRKKSFALDLGQLIGLRHGSATYVLRIEMIDYHSNRVDIKGRSVATAL